MEAISKFLNNYGNSNDIATCCKCLSTSHSYEECSMDNYLDEQSIQSILEIIRPRSTTGFLGKYLHELSAMTIIYTKMRIAFCLIKKIEEGSKPIYANISDISFIELFSDWVDCTKLESYLIVLWETLSKEFDGERFDLTRLNGFKKYIEEKELIRNKEDFIREVRNYFKPETKKEINLSRFRFIVEEKSIQKRLAFCEVFKDESDIIYKLLDIEPKTIPKTALSILRKIILNDNKEKRIELFEALIKKDLKTLTDYFICEGFSDYITE